MTELDREWAREILEWWKANATAAKEPGREWAYRVKARPLLLREHQTRLVLKRVLRRSEVPKLVMPSTSDKAVFVNGGIDLATYAIGVLDTEQETAVRLGSNAPLMAADALHQTIWHAASQLWSDGHYGQAVQRAATLLNADVQDRLNRHDVSDVALMQQTFSLSAPEPGKPRLRWPGEDDDLTVRAMRSGILNFAQGCYLAIRNPATHGSDERSRQVWLEQLATLSALARWIDECEVLRSPEGP